MSLPLPIECWVYNATRSLSHAIHKRRHLSIQNEHFLCDVSRPVGVSNRCTQRTSSLFFTFLLLSPGTSGEIHGHYSFGEVGLLLMVPENSTKMARNPLQGSYSTSGERCRGRCYRDKKRRGETRMSLSPLITIIFLSSGSHSSRDR